MKAKFLSVFAISTLFWLTACGGDASIETLIRQKAYDGEISAAELAELQKTASLDCAALTAKIADVMSKTKKGAPTVAPCSDAPNGGGTNTDKTLSKIYNVYVENSASMFGYMEGSTEFREVMLDLSSRLEEKGMKNNFLFINDKPYPVTSNFRDFITAFNPQSARKYGKTDASVLDKMLEQIVAEVVKTGNSAIFASDFIYDIGGKNPQSELLNVKFTIKTVFSRLRAAGDYGVLALRFSSAFKGTYYDYKNGKTALNGEKRPFYIWIIAKNATLQTFEQDYRLENLKGLENAVLFYAPNANEKRYLSFLPQTEVVGSFSRARGEKAGSAVTEIEGVTGDSRRDNMIQFAVAVDMKNIPVSESFLSESANYDIKTDLDLSLVKVLPIDKAGVHKNDERFKGTATHVLIFTTRDKISKDQHAVTLSLKQVMPNWVDAASSDDDSKIKTQLGKTFGLSALFSGLAEAYIPSGTTPFHSQWTFTLKK
jgi:hypothetical protein